MRARTQSEDGDLTLRRCHVAVVADHLARDLHHKGEIASTYEDLPFGERLIAVYNDSDKVHQQYFDFSLPQKDVQPDTPFWAGPAVFNALRNERLLDAF